MNKIYKIIAIATMTVVSGATAWAGPVGSITTFTPNTTAVASEVNANFTEHTTQINDNDARIGTKQDRVNGTCSTGQSISAISATGLVTCEVDSNTTYSAGSGLTLSGTSFSVNPMPGLLIDSFLSNVDSSIATLSTISGYYNLTTNYIPAVNARVHIFARCTLDSYFAGTFYRFRVATRSPTGTITTGNSSDIPTYMAAANQSVMHVNNDFFNLIAGQSYDFGVNFTGSTPGTGTNRDYCTLTAMVFSR